MKKQISGAALTAKKIREELKSTFPGVKFSVTSSTYSMGNSVLVKWTDGPVASIVDPIIKKYQYGYFDGMTDCYEYTDIDKDLECPGAKYVHTSRTQSPDLVSRLRAACDCIGMYTNTWGEFMAARFENDHPELWPESTFRDILKKQQKAQEEAARLEQERIHAEAEEARRITAEKAAAQNKPMGKVLSFADYKARKEQKQTEQRMNQVHMLLSGLTSSQLAEACRRYDAQTPESDEKRAVLAYMLSALNDRDETLAVSTFMGLSIFPAF